MYQILGQTTVTVNTEEAYVVTPADGTAYTWSVTKGYIVSGQGTANITVHWTDTGQGEVGVTISGGGSGGGSIVIVIDIDG